MHQFDPRDHVPSAHWLIPITLRPISTQDFQHLGELLGLTLDRRALYIMMTLRTYGLQKIVGKTRSRPNKERQTILTVRILPFLAGSN